MNDDLLISVIVPAHNAAGYVDSCLGALLASDYQSREIIVVDDGSTDESAALCRREGVAVYRTGRRSGPAAARNEGARRARGRILFFVDADVVVRRDTLSRVAADFREAPDIAAVFGSYDAAPGAENFLSQYKNLHHHFVHQRSSPEAATFWAGCGAVRREAFERIGGFDQGRYAEPSVEDIELGYRLRRAGGRILLDKGLQVKHLKRWRPVSLIRADVLHRAIPWSELLLESREIINDLNLRTADRVSAGLCGLSLLALALAAFAPPLLGLTLLCWLAILLINRDLYLFFLRERGLPFAAAVFPLQLLYYTYSGAAFALCWAGRRLGGPNGARPSRQRG